jgi:acyl-CoA thioester hydrolase
MHTFRFYHPISIRYADLDPQGHVNNATYLTYCEEARIAYIQNLGLWDGKSFLDVGIILAESRVTYRAPILLSQRIQVGVKVSRIGNKSLEMSYQIEDRDDGQTLAQASTVLVSYDYRREQTIPVPDAWRRAIQNFEGLEQPA